MVPPSFHTIVAQIGVQKAQTAQQSKNLVAAFDIGHHFHMQGMDDKHPHRQQGQPNGIIAENIPQHQKQEATGEGKIQDVEKMVAHWFHTK